MSLANPAPQAAPADEARTAPPDIAEALAEWRARLTEAPIQTAALARFLDVLDPEVRTEVVRSTNRGQQRRLYAAVDGFAPVRLADLVPPGVAAGETVRHYGRNTLPAFTTFEKRFARPTGADPDVPAELHGFNYQALRPITGPGYFVAVEDPDRAEVLVDYRRVPDAAPEGWPAVRRNEVGLSRFIYGFMVDTLRGVSLHVTIGSAARKGRDMGSWFVLCRDAGAA